MWPGAHGNVNSLAYSKSESCAYALKDNFDPRQGTVSFWVASLGWKPSAKVFQWFFTDLEQCDGLVHAHRIYTVSISA